MEQRRSRRFDLKLPVELVRAGVKHLSAAAETSNVSSAGVLIGDPGVPLEIGQSVEYYISLPSGRNIGQIRLRCMGKVVRRDDQKQAYAATLERYEFVRS